MLGSTNELAHSLGGMLPRNLTRSPRNAEAAPESEIQRFYEMQPLEEVEYLGVEYPSQHNKSGEWRESVPQIAFFQSSELLCVFFKNLIK